MSIYIRGMKIPKNCTECGQFRWSNFLQNEVCIVAEVIGSNKIFQSASEGTDNRPTWCPLVPVPPHGKLIEADAAKELMKPVDSIREREPEWTWGELHEIYCKELDNLPTIIPADKEGEG